MNAINVGDFEMVMPSRKGRRSPTGFRHNAAAVLRIGLHANGDQTPQFSIAFNNKAMELSRFVGGDRLNVSFTKDKKMMMVERHPKGVWTLSPIGSTKEQREDAVGKPHSSSVKFCSPGWALGIEKMRESFTVEGKDLAIEGSRILAQVNLG